MELEKKKDTFASAKETWDKHRLSIQNQGKYIQGKKALKFCERTKSQDIASARHL